MPRTCAVTCSISYHSLSSILDIVAPFCSRSLVSFSVHRPYIIRQQQREDAVGGNRARKSPTAENLYGSVVGKRQVVVRSAKRFGKGLELLVSADELYRVGL